jgi:hypothetical protein
MKNLIVTALLLVFIAGCVSQPAETKDTLEKELDREPIKAPVKTPIKVTDSGNIQVIEVKAENVSGRWKFPLENRTDEFIDIGFHSDVYIVLNNSHVKFLDNNESIWITPLVKDERMMLFNALYAREVDSCKEKQVAVLGKTYAVDTLKNGSSFEFDDKWKIAWEEEGGCRKRLIIYMDGYYSDLKEGEQINLFRNDNTLLLKVTKNPEEQMMEIIATKPR